jgi:hypothetical protein
MHNEHWHPQRLSRQGGGIFFMPHTVISRAFIGTKRLLLDETLYAPQKIPLEKAHKDLSEKLHRLTESGCNIHFLLLSSGPRK